MSLRLPLRVRACAKINLTLRVLGIRPDGYHELRTVLQSLALHDTLTFTASSGPLQIACRDARVPLDDRNLVWRAAQALWRAAGRRGTVDGVRVAIRKRIPMQAGLGGGSSDAAATLRTLAHIWCPAMPQVELEAIGATLGADVPFFFRGGTALGVERGDRLFQLADHGRPWVVLAQPDFGVSTADAYGWFDATLAKPSGVAHRPSRRSRRPRRGALGPFGDGGNDLQAPVAARHPAISRLVRALMARGACWSAMSGSGSVCFGLFPTNSEATATAAALATARCATIVTRAQTMAEFSRASTPVSGPMRLEVRRSLGSR